MRNVRRVEAVSLQPSRDRSPAVDAVALVPGPNLSYFSGATFHLSERPVLGLFPVRGKPVFLVPVLEAVRP